MVEISSLRAWFEEGSRALGVRIELEPKIVTRSGVVLEPVAWLPDFGGMSGTLVFEDGFTNRERAKLARESGYTSSAMGSISKSFDFDLDDFIDVLSDWTWSSSDQPQPIWVRKN
jgi:hypothetical protein